MAGDETTRKVIQILIKKFKRTGGSSVLNPEAVFLRFVLEAFLLFLAPAGGGSNLAGQSLTLN